MESIGNIQDDVFIPMDNSRNGLVPEKMEISFDSVTYSVKKGKKKKQQKTILQGISGIFHESELVAVMGASGAGKSSFVDLIAGDPKPGKVEGVVKINGRSASSYFKKIGSYVRQADVLSPLLTVQEVFQFYAELLLNEKASEKKRVVDQLISDLNLDKSKDTLIGNELTRGVSGGEMKRVAIGSSLISDPKILILDEPTSGLDSSTAHSIVTYLKELTQHNRTIICTIHQPSASTFFLFDKLLLLNHGKTVFFGPTTDVVPYFANLGFQCAQYENPADFMIDCVEKHSNEGSDNYFDFATAYANSVSHKQVIQEIESKRDQNIDDKDNEKFIASGPKQFLNFAWRNWLQFLRDKRLSINTLVMALVSALLIGIIFLRIDYDCFSIRSRFGALFLLLFVATQMAMPWFYLIFETRPVFLRERKTHNISVFAYYCAQTLSEIPLYLCTLLEAIIPYYMVGFRVDFGYFMVYLCIVLVNILVMTGIVILSGSLASNLGVGMIIVMAIFGLSILFSGFFVQITQLPIFLRWLVNLSFIKYALELIIVNEFYGQSFPSKTNNISGVTSVVCNITSGLEAMSLLGFVDIPFEIVMWRNFLILFAMLFFYRTLAFLACYFFHK